MKKIFVVILALGLYACSKSDDTETDPREAFFLEAIIGSWSYDTIRVNGELFLVEHADGCDRDLFQFYNREGKEFEFEERVILNCDTCAQCATSSTNLEWDLSGDTIDLYFGDRLVLTYTILEVTESIFRYAVEADFDEDGTLDQLEISAISYDPYGDFD